AFRSSVLGALRIAGPCDRGCIDCAYRTVLKADRGGRDILGIDRAKRRRRRKASDILVRPDEVEQQIERVNRLCEQHATAVAGLGPASRKLEIGVIALPANRSTCRDDRSKLAGVENGFQPKRRRTKPVLQAD